MENGYMIPKLIYYDEKNSEIKDCGNMLIRDDSITYMEKKPGEESPIILLDFEKKTTGYPFLYLEASSNDSILIEYGPTKDSMFSKKIIKMPRINTLWVADDFIACRYMKISIISDSVMPVKAYMKVKRIGAIFSAYPCVNVGSFNSNDEILNKIWEVGAYTVQLCMQKNSNSSAQVRDLIPEYLKKFIKEWKNEYSQYVIFDGPRRDRETWIGDIRTEALTIHTCFGAHEVIESSLMQFYDLQKNDGLVPGSGGTRQEFKEYNFWWIITIWEEYLYTGDTKFLRRIYPGVRNLIEWIYFNIDHRGFIYNDKNWMWTFPREGYSSSTQCILYYALVCASKIEEVMENTIAKDKLIDLSKTIKNNINKEYWDEVKGIYIDDLKLIDYKTPVFLDVNSYAITFGITSKEQSIRILKYLKNNMWTDFGSTTIDEKIIGAKLDPSVVEYQLKNSVLGSENPEGRLEEIMWPHNKQIWPFITAYEVEANLIMGNIDEAIELTKKCWGNMLIHETGTFWEMVDSGNGKFNTTSFQKYAKDDVMNSAAHGWSGWISYILQTYILGIKPIEAGFNKVMLSPKLGKLTNLNGKVPTPYGTITVDIIKNEKVININYVTPIEVKLEIDYKSEDFKNKDVYINGEIVNLN